MWVPVCIFGMRLVVYEFVPCWSGEQNVEGSGHSLLRPFQVTKCFLLSQSVQPGLALLSGYSQLVVFEPLWECT